mmetsp:Transcript_18970/g.75647  ORF Transcript_18970/g.75647 Transcript_18970/m.75647 type:complete len:290 (+) Transcript_18970:1814-2683(+)
MPWPRDGAQDLVVLPLVRRPPPPRLGHARLRPAHRERAARLPRLGRRLGRRDDRKEEEEEDGVVVVDRDPRSTKPRRSTSTGDADQGCAEEEASTQGIEGPGGQSEEAARAVSSSAAPNARRCVFDTPRVSETRPRGRRRRPFTGVRGAVRRPRRRRRVDDIAAARQATAAARRRAQRGDPKHLDRDSSSRRRGRPRQGRRREAGTIPGKQPRPPRRRRRRKEDDDDDRRAAAAPHPPGEPEEGRVQVARAVRGLQGRDDGRGVPAARRLACRPQARQEARLRDAAAGG